MHVAETEHKIGWDEAEVVCREEQYVDKAEDKGRSANQGTRWQPQFGY